MGDNNKLVVITLFTLTKIEEEKNATIANLMLLSSSLQVERRKNWAMATSLLLSPCS
jgi:hypothetical protein